MTTVGPTTNTKMASNAASTILKFDRYWMPLPTPEMADRMNARVSTAMTPMITSIPGSSTIPEALSPAPICIAPSPSEQAVPKTVATIEAASMNLPSQPAARLSPIRGMNAEDSSCLLPIRKVE